MKPLFFGNKSIGICLYQIKVGIPMNIIIDIVIIIIIIINLLLFGGTASAFPTKHQLARHLIYIVYCLNLWVTSVSPRQLTRLTTTNAVEINRGE